MSDWPVPREAASVILLRERGSGGGAEVFLLRRHRKASFMRSAFVFPGGAADPGEDDPRVTAARELFEEAGVLLATGDVPEDVRERWRQELHDRDARPFGEMLAEVGAELDLDALAYFAHWVTPSIEKKRFSARFYAARLPAGQVPSFDNRETVDEVWVTPAEALERSKELMLPPPQVRTFAEMQEAAEAGADAVMQLARDRERAPHPILPRMCPVGDGFALLLPWDPDYVDKGTGDARPMPADHPLAVGPSRFVLEDGTWKNIDAPGSTRAG